MIIDSFMFFNEYDILEGRLEYLYDVVDCFAIVETDRTHSGRPKRFNYIENIQRYSKYSDKILYYPYSTDERQYDWHSVDTGLKMDNDQRNHMSNVLKYFKPDDIVLLSDLDEIPHKNILKDAISHLGQYPAITLGQELFYYNLRQKHSELWAGTIVTTVKTIMEKTPQGIRDKRWDWPAIEHGGWHLSYWGDIKHIQTKIKNFAHQEFNNETSTNTDNIRDNINNGCDVFGEKMIPVNRSNFPQDFLQVFEKYEPVI